MRKYGHIVCTVVVILSTAWTATTASWHGKQSFIQVAYIGRGTGTHRISQLAGYDTDHDDREELLLPDDHAIVRLFEHMGSNQYEPVLQLPERGCWVACDIDYDGLTDIVIESQDSLEV